MKKKKQVRTYGPSGLTEIRLRKLMAKDKNVESHVLEAGFYLCQLFDLLRTYGFHFTL